MSVLVPELDLVEGLDLPLPLFPLFPLFPLEPLKFVDCFATGPGLQFPVFPPTFFFNQSRPLFTALSATCLVTLFTLFANESNMFEHGLSEDLLGGFVPSLFTLFLLRVLLGVLLLPLGRLEVGFVTICLFFV